MEVKVILNIYDVNTQLNRFIAAVGLGMWHSGVEVHGLEFQYTKNGGIQQIKPKTAGPMPFKESFEIGSYQGRVEDVILYHIPLLKDDFSSQNYHITKRNCNHFAEALVKSLTGQSIPWWLNNAANTARFFGLLEEGGGGAFASQSVASESDSVSESINEELIDREGRLRMFEANIVPSHQGSSTTPKRGITPRRHSVVNSHTMNANGIQEQKDENVKIAVSALSNEGPVSSLPYFSDPSLTPAPRSTDKLMTLQSAVAPKKEHTHRPKSEPIINTNAILGPIAEKEAGPISNPFYLSESIRTSTVSPSLGRIQSTDTETTGTDASHIMLKVLGTGSNQRAPAPPVKQKNKASWNLSSEHHTDTF